MLVLPESSALRDVLAERRRQILVEGFNAIHDDMHTGGEISRAAVNYAASAAVALALGATRGLETPPLMHFGAPPLAWPWDLFFWKPDTVRRMLVKAGAMILAEIERLDRLAEREAS